MIELRCATLTQPWASLVAINAKHYETRGWSTKYRGPLGIHAAKGWTRDDKELCREQPFAEVLCDAGLTTLGHIDRLRGHVLCVVDLVDVLWTGFGGVGRHDLRRRVIDLNPLTVEPAEHEWDFGNYGRDRYVWILRNLRPLATPVPAKGALGLWTPLDDARAAIAAQLDLAPASNQPRLLEE